MPDSSTDAPWDNIQGGPPRRPTQAAVHAARQAAAEHAERAYAMLDASRAEEQEAQRLLRSAKDRPLWPNGNLVDDRQGVSHAGHGRAHPAAPDRALCAARTKPLRVLAGGDDPLRGRGCVAGATGRFVGWG